MSAKVQWQSTFADIYPPRHFLKVTYTPLLMKHLNMQEHKRSAYSKFRMSIQAQCHIDTSCEVQKLKITYHQLDVMVWGVFSF